MVSIAMLRLIETGMPKKAPVYRFDKNGDKIVNLEQYICMAEIHWYSSKKNGILFHNFRIWSNMIFPVCFVDKKDTPISQVVCVRLVKEHFYRWKRVTVYQITDVLRQEQVKEGQKFYIFNARERIGEGVVTDKRG